MSRDIKRILIANRSEIAVRIIHACHDDGLAAIAVYADGDADSLFVQLADEAYAIPGRTPGQTYLNIDAIISIAERCHADAVHPGYGFLSENADFAQAVIDAGLVWIGPSPQTIRALGDKVQARRIAKEVGAPMVPGTTTPVRDAAEVVAFAREHGLPVAIKAVHGGGGRGLKVVRRLQDVEEAFLSATHEAEVAFGNGDCFIERFLDKPRHVEVQILGDEQGHVIAVGTRDCSLQRRNQKLIEEAPAPFLTDDITTRLMRAAVAICEHAGYVSAGTVEFLVDYDGSISFMEVNTRIQVEHPVTELVTGIDLVREQLRIAQGGSVLDVHPQHHGHAIEMRINAEDPAHGFVPFPGTVTALRVPSGPGIRFDTGIAEGSRVGDQFDSMLAKLVVYADTREQCIVRARRALHELRIEGVPTVVSFDRAVLEDPDFTATDHIGVYTRWIEESFLPRTEPSALSTGDFGPRASQHIVDRTWIEVDGRRLSLGLPAGLAAARPDTVDHTIDEGDGAYGATPASEHAIVSSSTGTLSRWLVNEGDGVEKGEPVAVIEAMKMESEVTAPCSGVAHLLGRVGDTVRMGQQLGDIDVHDIPASDGDSGRYDDMPSPTTAPPTATASTTASLTQGAQS